MELNDPGSQQTACNFVKVCLNMFMIQAKKYMSLSLSLRSIIIITSLDHSVTYLLF